MKRGTKSLLFGCHQFIIHPVFVYRAWIILYKKLPNFWETVCIVIHDWGYWGCPNMDGPEGEGHPFWAERFFWRLWCLHIISGKQLQRYGDLCRLHSAAAINNSYDDDLEPSELYYADKLGTVLMPPWLWVGLGRLTGEIDEYVHNPKYQRDWCGDDPYKHFACFREVVDAVIVNYLGG